MDGWILTLFILAAFAGGFVSGFSGFAMGLVVSGVWLHIITPIQTAALIAGYGLLTQGYGILKLRQALDWQKIWPLSLGTTIGIPIGVILLSHLNPVYLRFGVGVLLVLYTVYGLARPAIKPMKIGVGADIGIGIVNGLVGGLTGLGGVSTGAVRCLCGHLHFNGHHRRVHVGYASTVRTGLPIHARRPVERVQALWSH
ncbi:MAG TPA: sulfite exporter TauE/SafE family protein [Pseudolabrys sp.]|nr:sulfite exporter TauE/SafE family protein [Pseudolabrys sp.]